MWLTNLFCYHGNGCGGLNICAKFHGFMYKYNNSYGLGCVIIACGHLTNMQCCHDNCSFMCVQSNIVEGICIMQIQTKGDLSPEAILT